MSKRKTPPQSPTIPQTTLERAQQQVEQTTDDVVQDVAVTTENVKTTVEAAAEETGLKTSLAGATPLTPPARRVRAVRTGPGPARPANNRNNNNSPKKDPKTDTAYIRNRLANPTRFVTESELRVEYGYVTKDLRAMGLLAAVLVAVLFVLARVL